MSSKSAPLTRARRTLQRMAQRVVRRWRSLRPAPKALARAALAHGHTWSALLALDGRLREAGPQLTHWCGAAPLQPGALLWKQPPFGYAQEQQDALREAAARAAAAAADHTEHLALRLPGPRGAQHLDVQLRRLARPPALLLLATNTTAQAQVSAKLQLAAVAFEQAREGLFIANSQGVVLTVNAQFTRLLQCAADSVCGQPALALLAGSHHTSLRREVRVWLARRSAWEGEIDHRDAAGDARCLHLHLAWRADLHQPGLRHLLGTLTDITAQHRAQRALDHHRQHDALTALPNRRLFAERLQWLVAACTRSGQPFALLSLNLNRFREVNQRLGYDAGDAALVEVARRLQAALRESDVVARVGSDQFAVLLPATTAEGAAQVAHKLIACVAAPMRAQGSDLALSISAGVAMFPLDAPRGEELTRCADAAMQQARQDGCGTLRAFDASMLAHQAVEPA